MDSDSFFRLSSGSRRFQFRSDVYSGRDEFDVGEESRPEYLCPFCGEDFDILGLCCHIDEEHAVEAKNGVCPFCAKRVGIDLVGHFTSQHGSLLRIQRRRRIRRGSSNSLFSVLRRELREGNLDSFLGGSPFLASQSNSEADPLSAFIRITPVVDESPKIQHFSSSQRCPLEERAAEDSSERNMPQSSLSDKDHREKAQKCEFVQELLLSTFFDDL